MVWLPAQTHPKHLPFPSCGRGRRKTFLRFRISKCRQGWWQLLLARSSAPSPSIQHHQAVFRLSNRFSSLTTKSRERTGAVCLCIVTLNTFKNGLLVADFQSWKEQYAAVPISVPFPKQKQFREERGRRIPFASERRREIHSWLVLGLGRNEPPA